MERQSQRNAAVALLTKSTHGDLTSYVEPLRAFIRDDDEEFLAHLIAWNQRKGQVRDTKVALPVVHLSAMLKGLRGTTYLENALAHLALQPPRMLVQARSFARTLGVGNRALNKLTERYLRFREERLSMWDKAVVQDRESMKRLYALAHLKPSARANAILFERHYPPGSPFEALKFMHRLTPVEIAGEIIKHRLPFLPLQAALGKRIQEEDVALAVINAMTPTELVTNSKLLEKMGVQQKPALRHAYREAMERVAKSDANVLKTSVAAAATDDAETKVVLSRVQEKQLTKLQTLEGNWLILVDKSGSMQIGIETGLQVAAIIARSVKGRVHLVFFDTQPRYVNATGRTLDELRAACSGVTPGGGTSIGIGLQYARVTDLQVDGIVVVSDGEHVNGPAFEHEYPMLTKALGKEPPVYYYRVGSGNDRLGYALSAFAIPHQAFDLRAGVDFYSLPNVVQTMRSNIFSLSDEIMATPLLQLKDVFAN